MSEVNGRIGTIDGSVSEASPESSSALAVLASTLIRRLNFAGGYQYGTKRDLFTVAGYPHDPEFKHYLARWDRQDVAGRIVDMMPKTTWRNAPIVSVEGSPDGTDFTAAVEWLAKERRMWSYMARADRISRIGGYGVLLIGQAGEVELRSELERMERPEDVLYFSPFSEGALKIDTWDNDPRSERFGLPETYSIDLSSGVEGFSTGGNMTEVVHWTRVIHIAEDKTMDEVHGRPALRRVLNRLIDMDKILASTGEGFWQQAVRALAAKLDKDAELSPEQLAKFGEALEEMVHDLRRQITIKGGDVGWLDSMTPDPMSAIQTMMVVIAAAEGIPKRVLFGTETGERASSEDIRQFHGEVSHRQTNFAEPDIVRQTIDRLVEYGAIPDPGDDGYLVTWPPLSTPTEEELAGIQKTRAETAKALTPLGADPAALVTIDDQGVVQLNPTV